MRLGDPASIVGRLDLMAADTERDGYRFTGTPTLVPLLSVIVRRGIAPELVPEIGNVPKQNVPVGPGGRLDATRRLRVPGLSGQSPSAELHFLLVHCSATPSTAACGKRSCQSLDAMKRRALGQASRTRWEETSAAADLQRTATSVASSRHTESDRWTTAQARSRAQPKAPAGVDVHGPLDPGTRPIGLWPFWLFGMATERGAEDFVLFLPGKNPTKRAHPERRHDRPGALKIRVRLHYYRRLRVVGQERLSYDAS
jgi:hypothetical protein